LTTGSAGNKFATSEGKSGAPKGYQLNAKESALLDSMIQSETETFGKGGTTEIGSELKRVSAQDVTNAYERTPQLLIRHTSTDNCL